MESHLLQMRGLKHCISLKCDVDREVASFTDAWIETPDALKSIKSLPSHLLQMRGLKLYQGNWDICIRRRIFYRCVD